MGTDMEETPLLTLEVISKYGVIEQDRHWSVQEIEAAIEGKASPVRRSSHGTPLYDPVVIRKAVGMSTAADRSPPRPRPVRTRTEVERICSVCGDEFYVLLPSPQATCGGECRKASVRARQRAWYRDKVRARKERPLVLPVQCRL